MSSLPPSAVPVFQSCCLRARPGQGSSSSLHPSLSLYLVPVFMQDSSHLPPQPPVPLSLLQALSIRSPSAGLRSGGISATRARLMRSSRQASADRHLLTPCSCCSRFSSSCKLIAAFNFLPTHLLLLAGSFVEQEGEAKGQPWLWGLLMGRQLRGCGA